MIHLWFIIKFYVLCHNNLNSMLRYQCSDLCTGETNKSFGHTMKSSVTLIAQQSSPFLWSYVVAWIFVFVYLRIQNIYNLYSVGLGRVGIQNYNPVAQWVCKYFQFSIAFAQIILADAVATMVITGQTWTKYAWIPN